jgi:hypothetical protein
MARPTNNTTRGRGYWKLNASLLQDQQIHAMFKREWDIWKKNPFNGTHPMCNGGVGMSNVESECYFVVWDQSADQTIETLKRFYYTSMHDRLHDQRDYQAKASALKLLKAKIVRLHAIHYKTIMVDNGEKDKYNEEEPSLFHILKEKKKTINT